MGKKKEKLIPMGDMVIVKMDEAPEVSEGGVLLPEMAQERPLTGTVKAVGEGMRNEEGVLLPTSLKVGDRVLLPGGFGSLQPVPGKPRQVFVSERAILALIDED